MATHKFTSQSRTFSQPSVSKQSSLPLHSPPFTTQEETNFPRKSSQLHAVSDKVGYVSPQYSSPDIPPSPSSPGKLAQKYIDHLHPPGSSHRRLFGKEQMSALSQDSVGVQSSKATALVAPYVGDSAIQLSAPQLNQDLDSESPLLNAKQKLVSVAHSSSGDSHSSDKWKLLVKTKDHLLTQKNLLIER